LKIIKAFKSLKDAIWITQDKASENLIPKMIFCA